MENPTNNNQPADQEEVKQENTQAAAAEGEERKIMDGEEEKKGEGEEAEELFETNWDLEVDNFDDMGLKEEVLRGIYAFGFKEPSPIQQKGILPII
jgi:translation initiation factor 4A